jgi:hypothetical protein
MDRSLRRLKMEKVQPFGAFIDNNTIAAEQAMQCGAGVVILRIRDHCGACHEKTRA